MDINVKMAKVKNDISLLGQDIVYDEIIVRPTRLPWTGSIHNHHPITKRYNTIGLIDQEHRDN